MLVETATSRNTDHRLDDVMFKVMVAVGGFLVFVGLCFIFMAQFFTNRRDIGFCEPLCYCFG